MSFEPRQESGGLPDGQPQIMLVWCNRKGDCLFINVMKGFRKERNMRLNPKVSLLAYDPRNPLRHIEIRGCVVEMTEEGAVEQDDELARRLFQLGQGVSK